MAVREKYSAKPLKMKVTSLYTYFFSTVFKACMTSLDSTVKGEAKLVLVIPMHVHENFLFLRVTQNTHIYNSIPRNAPCNTEYDYIHMPTLIKR